MQTRHKLKKKVTKKKEAMAKKTSKLRALKAWLIQVFTLG